MAFRKNFEGYVNRGRNILTNLSLAQESVPQRRYKGSDIVNRVKVPLATIYTDEEKGAKNFPVKMQRDKMLRRLGYTLEEICILQDYYDTSPRRRGTDPAVTISFTNQKGGSWKTTTSSYFASCYASHGYRVALVDVDPQASATENLGFQPNIKINGEDTLQNFMTSENSSDPHFKWTYENITRIIKDTHNHNLKLIPSNLDMGYCDFNLTLEMGRNEIQSADDEETIAIKRRNILNIFTRLRRIIDIISDDFDIIILDGTPSVGLLPINIMLASDILVVPVPTEFPDFAATVGFCEIALDEYDVIAQHLGETQTDLLFPDAAILPTRFSTSNNKTVGSETVMDCIQATFSESVINYPIKKHDAVVSNLNVVKRTVFDVNPGLIKTSIGDINIQSSARKKALQNYEYSADLLLNKYIKSFWPSRAQEHEAYIRNLELSQSQKDSSNSIDNATQEA